MKVGNMWRVVVGWWLLGCVGLGVTGCRKDLCYNHDEHSLSVKIWVEPEWQRVWERTYGHDWQREWKAGWPEYETLRPEASDGIRVMAYRANETREYNLAGEGGRLYLLEGESDLLFYNNDTEYIVFDELVASTRAVATTRTLTRSSFKELHKGERTINQPDMLYGNYQEGYQAERTLEKVLLPVTLKPLVYTYLVRFEFSQGVHYVALARGALAGMAEKVYLRDGHTGNEKATVMFDGTVEQFGVEARVRTFGVPNHPGDDYTKVEENEERFSLNLEVRLTNGKFKTFEFDVTEQVKKQPRGGVIMVEGIEIDDEEGAGGGGFDVDVEGWGDCIDIILPL